MMAAPSRMAFESFVGDLAILKNAFLSLEDGIGEIM